MKRLGFLGILVSCLGTPLRSDPVFFHRVRQQAEKYLASDESRTIQANLAESLEEIRRETSHLNDVVPPLSAFMERHLDPRESVEAVLDGFVFESRFGELAHILAQWARDFPERLKHLRRCYACNLFFRHYVLHRGGSNWLAPEPLLQPRATPVQPDRQLAAWLEELPPRAPGSLPMEVLDLDGDHAIDTVRIDGDLDGKFDICHFDLDTDQEVDRTLIRGENGWQALE